MSDSYVMAILGNFVTLWEGSSVSLWKQKTTCTRSFATWSGTPCVQTSWSERNRGVSRVCAVWSAKTRRFPSSRRGLCLAPAIGCKLSTNRKRKPKWRRCVAASIAVGPSAILTGSRTRPSDWGSNARFGPVEDRRNNRRLATVTCIPCVLQIWWLSPFTFLVAVTFHLSLAILTRSRTRPSDWGSNARFGPVEDRRNNRRLAPFTCTLCVLQIWWLSPFTRLSPPISAAGKISGSVSVHFSSKNELTPPLLKDFDGKCVQPPGTERSQG